jgi:hypothetical protein
VEVGLNAGRGADLVSGVGEQEDDGALARFGATSPTPFLAKPWHLASRTPTRRYFSTECPPPAEALR